MKRKKLAFVLGIRPDIIRASLILEYLHQEPKIETTFIWSGQHYSDNLKGIFLRELKVAPPAIELGCGGETDTEILGNLLIKLYQTLGEIKPDAVVYLGDTNTVASCIAPALLNIPVVHIEGGMRSYDWRMPEEKYRTVSDHLSDKVYVYFEEYKKQAVAEGINPNNIVVVGNPIVDILERFYFKNKRRFDQVATNEFFKTKGLKKGKYYVLTWHRRENVHVPKARESILNLLADSPYPVYFPASYRTQRVLKEKGLRLPQQVTMVDPIGYEELISLMVNSRGVLTDSGTVIEEVSILGIPGLQLRHSTERPQVYDVGGAVKFDPIEPEKYPHKAVFAKMERLVNKQWEHILGDGKSSKRIADDLIERLLNDDIRGHKPEQYHVPIERSYRGDGIKLD